MIISLCGQKGGAGKSTLAILLADEWHQRGHRVLLLDADPQGSALVWGEVAAEVGHDAPPTVAIGENLRQQVGRLAEGYDLVVIDCPGRVGKRQAAAMLVSDTVLLPCAPSTLDVWALGETVDRLGEVMELRPELRAGIVINRQTRTVEGRAARSLFEEAGLPVLANTVGQRVAFSESLAAGRGIRAYAGGSIAALEIRRLADEIEDFAAGYVEGAARAV